MNDLRAAAQQALEVLTKIRCDALYEQDCNVCNTEEALRAALAEPVQEAVAFQYRREQVEKQMASGYSAFGTTTWPAQEEFLNKSRAVAHNQLGYYRQMTRLKARVESPAQSTQEKNNAPAKLSVPHEWHTELATTCFARSYGGEGSYYCPHCDINAGSVWREHAWRPTKWQAICDKCRELFEE